MHFRTKQGIILEKLLHGLKHRYILCWQGEERGSSPFDCACCITYLDDDLLHQCGCVCHERIEAMANTRAMHLPLLAMAAMNELPFFPTSYEEDLKHKRKVKTEHDQFGIDYPGHPGCGPCENCDFVMKQNLRYLEHNRVNPCDCGICDEIRNHLATIPVMAPPAAQGPTKEDSR